MPDDTPPSDPKASLRNFLASFTVAPGTFVKEKIIDPLRTKEKQYYYHRRYRRVPSIDECVMGDEVCYTEANEQYKRDKKVDEQILILLRQRRMECETYYGHDYEKFCQKPTKDYDEAETNYFVKYGDLGYTGSVLDAYMKQKHRMIWERRYGEVGTGMNKKEES